METLKFNIPDCHYYVPKERVGFHYWELPLGKVIREEISEANHLLFILEGEISLTIDDYSDLPIKANEMMFIPISSEYKYVVKSNTKMLILTHSGKYPNCTEDFAADLARNFPDYTYDGRATIMKEPIINFAHQMVYYLINGISCNHLHEYKEFEFFIIVRHLYSNKEIATLFNYTATTNLGFSEAVKSNYFSARTAEELAAKLGYSEKVFTRLFNQHFNTTPYKWMQEHKARHIKSRLMNKSIPLKTIMDEFGFSTPSHFNVYCRRYLKDTPSGIRESFANNTEISNK